MRRIIIMLLITVLCLVLPGTVFHYFSWAGIKPDLPMLWVVYLALHHRTLEGIGYGFFVGLIFDIYIGRYIGLYAIVLVIVALLVSVLQKGWYKENVLLTMGLVFGLTALGQILLLLMASTAGLNWLSLSVFKGILGIAFYNCLLVPITYPLIHRSFTDGYLAPKLKYDR